MTTHNPRIVRWTDSSTGEIKERSRGGVDREVLPDGTPCENEWELSPLELALSLVPDLVDAIERAHAAGMDLTVHCWRVAG